MIDSEVYLIEHINQHLTLFLDQIFIFSFIGRLIYIQCTQFAPDCHHDTAEGSSQRLTEDWKKVHLRKSSNLIFDSGHHRIALIFTINIFNVS